MFLEQSNAVTPSGIPRIAEEMRAGIPRMAEEMRAGIPRIGEDRLDGTVWVEKVNDA
jgi:hypothetical protein